MTEHRKISGCDSSSSVLPPPRSLKGGTRQANWASGASPALQCRNCHTHAFATPSKQTSGTPSVGAFATRQVEGRPAFEVVLVIEMGTLHSGTPQVTEWTTALPAVCADSDLPKPPPSHRTNASQDCRNNIWAKLVKSHWLRLLLMPRTS